MRSIWHATNPTPPRFPAPGCNDLALGDLESAARRLDRALAIDGRDRAALKGRAEIDVARREPKKALERLDRALEIDPFDTEALYTARPDPRRAGRRRRSQGRPRLVQALHERPRRAARDCAAC